MTPLKIFIAIPAYGGTFYTPCVRSLFKLAVQFERRKWSSNLATFSHADIAECRNVLLTHWFDKTDAPHLLFLDTDMGFEPQLIFDMVDFDKPLVGAIYPKRKIDLDRFAKAIAAGKSVEKAEAGAHDFVVQRPSRGTARKGFMRVDACGTGIFLVQRACVELMLSKMPDIVDNRPPRELSLSKEPGRLIRAFDFLTVAGTRLSEDYSFCYRWREKCGGEVWANISHKITHVGTRHFTARYIDAPGADARTTQTVMATVIPNRPKTANPKS